MTSIDYTPTRHFSSWFTNLGSMASQAPTLVSFKSPQPEKGKAVGHTSFQRAGDGKKSMPSQAPNASHYI
jgi:hypothetical protein